MPPLHHLHAVSPNDKSTYHIRRYLWRSLLTFLGPLAVLAFFVWICLYYLFHPPVNDIVDASHVDGNWIFYAWFLISILMLDWARTGLANVEACALMHPALAPSTAIQLMWHADSNWANPLWWLRAIRSLILNLVPKTLLKATTPAPGGLWLALSSTMLLLFAAIPLSGLSFQTTPIQSRSDQQAPIYGPDLGTFAFLPPDPEDTSQRIRLAWQSGQKTSPRRGSLLYAPSSAKNVSTTYFDDQASQYAPVIETFVGPAVRETVTGLAWGMWAKVSCNPVPADKLLMIRTNGYADFAMKFCTTNTTETCDMQWRNLSQPQNIELGYVSIPSGLNETAYDWIDRVNYSMIVAADGYSQQTAPVHPDNLEQSGSPYLFDDNHDNCTIDHYSGRPAADVTSGSLELFLWQSRWVAPQYQDPVMQAFLENGSDVVQTYYVPSPYGFVNDPGVPWAGIGIHCDVESAVGFATLDPARRQFSNFTRRGYTNAPATDITGLQSGYIPSLQMQALSSLSPLAGSSALETNEDPSADEWSLQSNWRIMHQSLASSKVYVNLGADSGSGIPKLVYPLLRPEDIQKSVYKIFGESLISYMDEREIPENFTNSELYRLRTSTYITAGIVPWQYVLVLLSIWAAATSGAALWMLLFAGPRWAPTLDGFEMFKLGARYADAVDEFLDVDFQDCTLALAKVPGMVGLLPGAGVDDPGRPNGTRKPYLIGLSEVPLGPGLRSTETEFTFDQKAAAKRRY